MVSPATVVAATRSAADSNFRSGKGEWEGSGPGSGLDDGIAGEADAELVENLAVNLAQHHGGMNLTAAELREFLKGETAVRVLGAQHSEGNQHLIGVETRIAAAEIIHLHVLDRLDHGLRNELGTVVDAGEMLGGIQKQSRARAEQVGGLGADDGAVRKLDSGRWHLGKLLTDLGGNRTLAVLGADLSLLEQKSDLVHLRLIACALGHLVESGIIAAYDLIAGCITADILIAHTETHHIHAHIGRRLVRILTVNTLEESVQHRENLNVTVIVDGNLVIGLEMERINHVHIIKVGSSGLVGDVYRMLQRKVPHRESLELGISGLDTALMLLIELAQTHGHLSAARTRSRDNHQRAGGLHIVIATEALFGINQSHIVGIALDGIVEIGLYAQAVQLVAVSDGAVLAAIVGYDNGIDEKTGADEFIAQTKHVHIVGNTEVLTDLILLDVESRNDYDYLGPVTELLKHSQLAVRLESRQHAAGVEIVEKLASKFKIEFVAELSDALIDVLGLDPNVL